MLSGCCLVPASLEHKGNVLSMAAHCCQKHIVVNTMVKTLMADGVLESVVYNCNYLSGIESTHKGVN